MRPCLLASKAACQGASSNGSYHKFLNRNYSRCVCSASSSGSKQSNTWERDLAEVLREPQADVPQGRANKPLQTWQLQKLQAAAATGRRKIKVNELANELQLPRPEVLNFLKSYSPNKTSTSPDRAATPVADTRSLDVQPAETRAVPTQEPLASIMSDWESDDDQQHQAAEPVQQQPQAPAAAQPKSQNKSKPTRPFAERQRQGSDYEAKRMGRAAEATLERLYEESRRPSDEMLQGFLELHKGVPRRKVIDWFGERRRMDQAANNHSHAKQHQRGTR